MKRMTDHFSWMGQDLYLSFTTQDCHHSVQSGCHASQEFLDEKIEEKEAIGRNRELVRWRKCLISVISKSDGQLRLHRIPK